MSYFDFKDYRIHYRSTGHGDTALLFIHGLGGDLDSWKYQSEYFADRYEIVTVDLLGHGKSSQKADPVTAPRLDAEAVADLMQKEIKKPYFIIGHSFATNIIPEIIKIGDTALKGIVFVDCTYQGFDEIIDARLKFAKTMLGLPDDTLLTETQRWYDELIGDNVTEDDRRFIHASLERCDIRWLFESVAGCRQYCSQHPPEQTPIDDNLPVFIMEADGGVGSDLLKSWVNHFKAARYYLFEHAGHFFFVTERDKFNRLLDEFLRENS